MSTSNINKDQKGGLNPGNKANDLEQIRQSLTKRSLQVKFDLEGSPYKSIENIGAGAYGVVCSAVNQKTGDRVAIKKTSRVFEALTIAKRTYREIKILKHFKHDNIINIRNLLLPKEDAKSFADIYIVFDLMESDLHHIIYSQQALSEEHIRYFLFQILRGLKYIHSANVVHRDLKPSNLLVNEDCHLRIGDFGMARGLSYKPDEPSYLMTQYVATRWYRAPEILLSMIEYGTAVDMWSVGCIFAEMMGRKHLFPGKDYISQVKLILGVLGTPSEEWMKNCQNNFLKRIIKSFGKKQAEPWEKVFPKASKKSIDLLSKMLMLNPADRISVDQALSHRLLNHYHDPDDEPICVPAFNFDFENEEMDMNDLRKAVMKEILDFHQPKTPPTLSFHAMLRPAPKGEEEEEEAGLEGDDSDRGVGVGSKDGVGVGGIGSFGQQDIFKKDIVLTAVDKEEPELKSVSSQGVSSSYEAKKSDSNKSSPVFVDTSKSSLDIPLADIEMLSAKSNNGMMDESSSKTMTKDESVAGDGVGGDADVAVVAVVPDLITTKKEGGGGGGGKRGGGGNTISEDTKALVKQALFNATQRRQRDNQGEDGERLKPVTAAQRQKEREDKRKKKKEKALEKGKKAKTKTVIPDKHISLSNEDLELLQRWTSMQFPPPPMVVEGSNPGPLHPSISPPLHLTSTNNNNSVVLSQNNAFALASLSNLVQSSQLSNKLGQKKFRQILSKSSVPSRSVVNVSSNPSGSMMLSSSQFDLSSANFIPVIAIPSSSNPGNMEIKRIMPLPQPSTANTATTTPPPNSKSVSGSLPSDATKNNLQKAIFRRASSSSSSCSSSSVSNPFPSSASGSNLSSISAVPTKFTSVPEQQQQLQPAPLRQNHSSLFVHHRHSTGNIEVFGQTEKPSMSSQSPQSQEGMHTKYSQNDEQQQQQQNNSGFQFQSAVSNNNDQDVFKLQAGGLVGHEVKREESYTTNNSSSISGKPSTSTHAMLGVQSNAFDALLHQPKENLNEQQRDKSPQNVSASAASPEHSSTTSPPLLPPPPYPFHQSPQSQRSSPSPNLAFPSNIVPANSPENSNSGQRQQPPPTYSQNSFELFPSSGNGTGNLPNESTTDSLRSQQNSGSSLIDEFFRGGNFNNTASNTNSPDYNLGTSPFLSGVSGLSGLSSSSPLPSYDQAMEQQETAGASSSSSSSLPFQNYRDDHHHFNQQQQHHQHHHHQSMPQQQQQAIFNQQQQQQQQQHLQQQQQHVLHQNQQNFQHQQQHIPFDTASFGLHPNTQGYDLNRSPDIPKSSSSSSSSSSSISPSLNFISHDFKFSPAQHQHQQNQFLEQQHQQQQQQQQQQHDPFQLRQQNQFSQSQQQQQQQQHFQQQQQLPNQFQQQQQHSHSQFPHHQQDQNTQFQSQQQQQHIFQHNPQQQQQQQQQQNPFHQHNPFQQQHHHPHPQLPTFTPPQAQAGLFPHVPGYLHPHPHNKLQDSTFGVATSQHDTISSNFLTDPSAGNPSSDFTSSSSSTFPSTSGRGPGRNKSPQLTISTAKGHGHSGRGDNSNTAITITTTTTAGANTSVTTAATTATHPDLIALLTKQLSKSQVVDAFPPALALTPRGTGAGYGLGMDLDSVLMDAQDIASMRVEQSPLSSSLLADWLDISGSISQADLEVLERELVLPSPMNVSYNDMGLG